MAKQSAQQNGPQQKMMHLPSSASHQQQQQQQQQQEQPDYVLAEKYHERFAHKLIGKMLKVHEDRRFKEMLKRQHEDRKSNASLSILEDEDDNDEVGSILFNLIMITNSRTYVHFSEHP